MHLVIDNYDSFTFNVVQYLQMAGAEVAIRRHDEITPEEIAELAPRSLTISPGPCAPDEAGISIEVIRRFAGQIPILGVCLGHQCIAQAFGGTVAPSRRPMHGKTSQVRHDGTGLFAGIEQDLVAARYHSLIVTEMPPQLRVVAQCQPEPDGLPGVVMGLCHRNLPVFGLQFHPESILTHGGLRLISNFLAISERHHLKTPRRAPAPTDAPTDAVAAR